MSRRLLFVRCALVALVASVMSAGCARDATLVPAPATSSAAASSSTAATDPAATGRIVASYGPATSAEAVVGEQIARRLQLLERLADAADGIFKLPRDIQLKGAECGIANAFYSPDDQSITLCYEIIGFAAQLAAARAGGDPAMTERRFTNIAAMIFFHELGHAAIDLYQLPTTGREEDNADQLATLILLSDEAEGGQRVLDAAQFWFDASTGTQPDARAFADEHSLEQQRGYNLLCWVYGADPTSYAQLVEPTGSLPASRAAGCPEEYSKLYNAWITLLEPYIQAGAGDNMAPS